MFGVRRVDAKAQLCVKKSVVKKLVWYSDDIGLRVAQIKKYFGEKNVRTSMAARVRNRRLQKLKTLCYYCRLPSFFFSPKFEMRDLVPQKNAHVLLRPKGTHRSIQTVRDNRDRAMFRAAQPPFLLLIAGVL